MYWFTFVKIFISPKEMGGKRRDSPGCCKLDVVPISTNGLYRFEHLTGSSLLECCARYWSELLMPLKVGSWPLEPEDVKVSSFSGENTKVSSPRPASLSSESRRAVSWEKTKHRSGMNHPVLVRKCPNSGNSSCSVGIQNAKLDGDKAPVPWNDFTRIQF